MNLSSVKLDDDMLHILQLGTSFVPPNWFHGERGKNTATRTIRDARSGLRSGAERWNDCLCQQLNQQLCGAERKSVGYVNVNNPKTRLDTALSASGMRWAAGNIVDPATRCAFDWFKQHLAHLPVKPVTRAIPNLPWRWQHQMALNKLLRLTKARKIIVHKADKSAQLVVMDAAKYDAACRRLLLDEDNYKAIPFNLNRKCAALIIACVKRYIPAAITPTQAEFLLQHTRNPRIRRFYALPKTHKEREKWTDGMPPMRPICGDIQSETSITGKLIAQWLKPIFVNISSYIKNSYDFIELVTSLSTIPETAVWLVADVDSLYPNIPLTPALQRVMDHLNPASPQDCFIKDLLDIQLRHNYFEFGGDTFQQVKGIPMGKAWAPAVASIYLDKWEKEAFQITNIKPLIYRRYIDDIICLMEDTQQSDSLLSCMQTLDPNIKLSGIQSGKSVHFLDVQLQLNNGCVTSRLYRKPTDTRVLLDWNSNHTKMLKTNILLGQYIRYSRLFTSVVEAEQEMRRFAHLMHKIRSVPKRMLRIAWKKYIAWRTRQHSAGQRIQQPFKLLCSIPATIDRRLVVNGFNSFKSQLPASIAPELCALLIADHKHPNLVRQLFSY